MKVKELIKKLSELPQDMEVFVDGYEGGYSDIEVSNPKGIALNVNKEDYLGPHEDDENSSLLAVILKRKGNG
jgi:hypothetical protein